jgi:membrane-associated phospholipid phosphatase
MWLVLGWAGAAPGEKLLLTASVTVLLSILPLAFALRLVKSGRARSLNLEDRRHRSQAMAVALAGGLLSVVLIAAVPLKARGLVLPIMVAYLVTTGALILINSRWRISLHMSSLAGFLAVVLFVARAAGGPVPGEVAPAAVASMAAVCVPAVGWSRLRLRAHSAGQLAGGAVVGFGLPYLFLEVFRFLNPFEFGA